MSINLNKDHNPVAVVDVLMVGTGEYTTGYVGDGKAADSDKSAGVVALTMLDLRRRQKVHRIGMCGVNGTKFPGIRAHLRQYISDVYRDMDVHCIETFPPDDQIDPAAYRSAITTRYKAGDVAIIFTPDDTHYDIAMECINHGMHVMVTKPIVQTLAQHKALAQAALDQNVLVAVEVHKRLDPFYADARDRARSNMLGSFQYMYAYMSQPKHQLDTFKAWAGKSSDISYYLNSHHVDWSEWTLSGRARPIRVVATASNGVAHSKGIQTEDSITLTVQWQNLMCEQEEEETTGSSGNHGVDSTAATATATAGGATASLSTLSLPTMGCAVYTASWVAPKSDVHSQQRFFYMGSGGEINIDQAHRGCTVATDQSGFASVNPLFMKYTPTNGYFSGQNCYGVKSLEHFIDACRTINAGLQQPLDYNDGSLATIHTTLQTTAILEAGRCSLDADSIPMDIVYHDNNNNNNPKSCFEPIGITPHIYSAGVAVSK